MTKTADDFSRAFYPFLHKDEKKSPELMEELRFSLLEKVRESDDVRANFFAANEDAIIAAANCLSAATAARRLTRNTLPSSSCTRSLSGGRRCPRFV